MPTRDHKVRVFISSTFKDMHAERDHLVTVVFPELRERCERLGLEFFDVDLRWGVPEKTVDGETANSWEYCRQWIDRVEPFFVCMLGQRYGWEPEPEQLKDADDRARQLEQKRSITDMEVRYAVLNTTLKRHIYFYLRAAEAPSTATDFVDPPPLLTKLDELKTEVRACGRPVRDYPCTWKDNAFTEMEAFGNAVLADLWSGVLRDERYVSKDVWRQVLGTDPDADPRYKDEAVPVPDDIAEQIIPLAKPASKNPLEAEREQMATFAASRLRWFQGRTKELNDLTAFILDPAEDNKTRLAVIAAVPGQGKSALMAKLSQSLTSPSLPVSPSPCLLVITHFVGATEQSSTAYALVKRLNDELDASGITFPERPTPEGQPKEEPKLDFNSLCHRLYERLGDYAGEKHVVILLDALNQLNDGHELGWLPYRLGPNVRIVVSCIEEPERRSRREEAHSSPDAASQSLLTSAPTEQTPSQKVLAALNSRHPQPLRIPLSELTSDDVRTIVVEYLREYCHELDREHLDTLCAIPQARNPLYLTVMLQELRTLGGNDLNTLVPARIAAMPQDYPDTVSLFTWVLQRMEAAEGFGKEVVQAWCLYLALGRVGMASRELADLLKRKLGPAAALTAQRIERGLRRYLQRRGETLDFFHGQLRQAVKERYGNKAKDSSQAHHEIAEYFRLLADPTQDKHWKGEHHRPFQEIAFHLIGSGKEKDWDELCDYLTDFRCLDIRIRAGQVFAVIADQKAAINVLPEFAEQARRERERIEECRRYSHAIMVYAHEYGISGVTQPQPVPPASVISEQASSSRETNKWVRAILSWLRQFRSSSNNPKTAQSASAFSPSLVERMRTLAALIANHVGLLAECERCFLPLAANDCATHTFDDPKNILAESEMPWLQRLVGQSEELTQAQSTFVLSGHTGEVSHVSLSFDGKLAISAGFGQDEALRIWNTESGKCVRVISGPPEAYVDLTQYVMITPDGEVALSYSSILSLWQINTGNRIKAWRPVKDFGHICVTADGQRLISTSKGGALQVLNIESGRCLIEIQTNCEIVSISGTPDGRLIMCSDSDNLLHLWDLENHKRIRTMPGHDDKVTCISLTPDGRLAISGSKDKSLRVWDLKTGKCLKALLGHTGQVRTVQITHDGRRAVSGGNDKTLMFWDLEAGVCLGEFLGHTNNITSASMTPDGRLVVTASSDHTVRVWNLAGEGTQSNASQIHGIAKTTGFSSRPHAASQTRTIHEIAKTMDFSSDGNLLLSVFEWERGVFVYDARSGRHLNTLECTRSVGAFRMAPNGFDAIFACDDQTVRVWNLLEGKCIRIFRDELRTTSFADVILAQNGHLAVTRSLCERSLRVWDIETDNCVRHLNGHLEQVSSLAAPLQGEIVVSGDLRGSLRIWDLETGQCRDVLEGHIGAIKGIKITPDGKKAISFSNSENSIKVWDLQNASLACIFDGHLSFVRTVSITPDCQFAVSGGADYTLRVWAVDGGRLIHKLQGHTNWIDSVRITADGKYAISSSRDNTIRVWSINCGQCLAVYYAGAKIGSFAASSKSDRIVCGTSDGQMHFLTMRNFPT